MKKKVIRGAGDVAEEKGRGVVIVSLGSIPLISPPQAPESGHVRAAFPPLLPNMNFDTGKTESHHFRHHLLISFIFLKSQTRSPKPSLIIRRFLVFVQRWLLFPSLQTPMQESL